MSFLRPLVSCLLVLVTVFLVSCSDGAVKPPTYSEAQLEQIAKTNSSIQVLRDRLPELATSIQKRDWVNVKSFIHGPLGELRARMSNLSRSLLPKQQAPALAASRDVFDHLNRIDSSADANDYRGAIRNYGEAIEDLKKFDTFLPNS
jgi:photosystem II protein PsbQ